MSKVRNFIPNLLSLCNAFFGGLGIYFIILGHTEYVLWCMVGSLICDLFDGFAARKLQAFSPLGNDIDSLSDVISFGIVPSALLSVALEKVAFFAPWLAFLIVPASVYRLAKFNHDDRQTLSFLGLPTPANALFVAGFSVLLMQNSKALTTLPRMIEYKVYGSYLALILILSYLLVSDIPMFSLKKVEKGSPELTMLIIVAIASLGGVLWLGWGGFALGLGLYILLNVGRKLAQLAIK